MQTLASIDSEERVVKKIDKDDNSHKSQEKFVHNVEILKNSFLYEIIGEEKFLVNSRHRCNVLKTNKFDIVRIF